MSETVRIEINDLENERQAVIAFYKRQIEAFHSIKTAMEKVQWADANYDRAVDALNAIGYALSEILQSISNGNDVFVISELIPLAEEYLANERKFPRI